MSPVEGELIVGQLYLSIAEYADVMNAVETAEQTAFLDEEISRLEAKTAAEKPTRKSASKLSKLEALANDQNAPINERIAALEKIKKQGNK